MLPRQVGTAFERVGPGLLWHHLYPAYPDGAAGTPRVSLSFWSLSYRLIDQIY